MKNIGFVYPTRYFLKPFLLIAVACTIKKVIAAKPAGTFISSDGDLTPISPERFKININI